MNLKAHLASIGMTSKEFSELLGINRNYLSLIMCGKKVPSERLKNDIESLIGERVELHNRCNSKKKNSE